MQEDRESIKEREMETGSFRIPKKNRKEYKNNWRMQTMVEIFSFGLERNQPVVTQKRNKMVPTERSTFNVDKKEEQVFGAGRR